MASCSESRPERLLLSCEHGGHEVPEPYAALFVADEALLRSHRGWDAGALDLARALARGTGAPLLASTVTRLLVDLNRSPHHPRLFSERSRRLGRAARQQVLERHYLPHRTAVEQAVADGAAAGARTLHVAVHSFTPCIEGRVRQVQIGLLYDPARHPERAAARRWQELLRARSPALRVRRNQPYRGNADGLTRWLRERFGADEYLGIELEVSHELLGLRAGETHRRVLVSLRRLLAARAV